MTEWLAWLLDLEHIRLGTDQPLSVEWQAGYARWGLFAFGLLLLAMIGLVYRREPGPLSVRVTLGVLRAAVLALVIAVICQPALVYQRNRVERARVQVLMDTSSSMNQADVYVDERLAQAAASGAGLQSPRELEQLSRLELARRALLADDAAAFDALARNNDVAIATFASTVESIGAAGSEETDQSDTLESLVADGAATHLVPALSGLFAQTNRPRLAAVVVVSDGRDTSGAAASDAIGLARSQQVPIYSVAVGSPEPRRDVALTRLVADDSVFANDLVSVRATVTARGLAQSTPVRVCLHDEADEVATACGEVRLGGDQSSAEIELTLPPRQPGRVRLRVTADAVDGEADLSNNTDSVEVHVLDDFLRLLYVESYPRFEYRYLKNALLRESTVRLSALLLAADPDFVQEGAEPIRRIPQSAEEFERFDAILFGDVDPRADWITDEQMRLIVDFVSRGGGFGLIAGERFAPRSFAGTPLEPLIPVQISATSATLSAAGGAGYAPRLTPAGRAARIFRFHADSEVSDAVFENLPHLYWSAGVLGPKPGAEVLLERPESASVLTPSPIVVVGRYGAGRTYYQGTDDTWRWRRHDGELVHDAYWVQVARMLMRPRHVGEDRRIAIRPDQPVRRWGERMMVRVVCNDPQVLPVLGETPELALIDANGFTVQKFRAERIGGEESLYEGAFVPRQPGNYRIELADLAPPPGLAAASAAVRIQESSIESLEPEADYALLRRLAESTGGRLVGLDELAASFATIEDRSIQSPDDVTEPLWDSKLVLILFGTLIALEWMVRKLYGML